MACVGVHVLAVEIIELVVALGTLVKHDFARPAGLRSLAGLRAEHGAFDFARVDALFHEHTPIMVGRFEHCGGKLGRIALMFDLGHAEAGTGAGRLHEQRVLQSGLLHRGKHFVRLGGEFGSGIIIAHIQRDAGSHGNTGRSQQYLRIMLVHASGGSEHTAANVWHVHHFEQALNRAILTVRTMQYRKHGVHVAKRSQRAVIFTSEETILAECHIQHHIFGGIRLLHHRQAFAHVPLAWILAAYDPLAVLGDSHLNGFELVSIQRAQHARRRDAGNRMLVGFAAIHHHNALFCHLCLMLHKLVR